mmetsp:Transcript_58450/g.139631  ORF Transcript_58450/g.139631 Transcript_58450/m.139631 type:complete len:212 (-) Transcript_58450:418-1053(-)
MGPVNAHAIAYTTNLSNTSRSGISSIATESARTPSRRARKFCICASRMKRSAEDASFAATCMIGSTKVSRSGPSQCASSGLRFFSQAFIRPGMEMRFGGKLTRPVRMTVEGEAWRSESTSKITLLPSARGMRSPLAMVSILVSSRTVFRCSIHRVLIGPSMTIHVCMFLFRIDLRQMAEKAPSFHSPFLVSKNPNINSGVSTRGFMYMVRQ